MRLAIVRTVLIVGFALGAFAQDTVRFIYPAKSDADADADKKLSEYLTRDTSSKIQFGLVRRRAYYQAIDDVLDNSTEFVARLTPYAYVAAELQGAQLEVLATYQSRATQTTTYHSYFIVRAETNDDDAFKFSNEPTTRELTDYLDHTRPRRTFIFHDKFSTSSYFVPSLFFRNNRIFHTDQDASGTLNPITVVELADKKTSELMMMIANHEVVDGNGDHADVAAVWDGTIQSFAKDHPAEMARLRKIPLPELLPNDLFVCSKTLSEDKKKELRDAIRSWKGCPNGKPAFGDKSDFLCWIDIVDAPEASGALAELRREAIAPPAPATVRISLAPGVKHPERYDAYLAAARQATRFAGSEFTVWDKSLYESQEPDFDWKIEPIHDGAILLHSSAKRIRKVPQQDIPVSFTDVREDLPRRIEAVIHTRLNRIRYLWPYSSGPNPLILRDVSFVVDPDVPLRVQSIEWTNPDKNLFTGGDEFDVKITRDAEGNWGIDPYKFELDPTPLKDALQEKKLDPMSNVAYRVVLVRPETKRPLFRGLTLGLVLLIIAAAAAAIYDWRPVRFRKKAGEPPVTTSPGAPLLAPAD